MPFNLFTGVFTPPAGATSAATGQVIQSAVWNTVHSDISTGLTTLMQYVQNLSTFENLLAPNGGFTIWQRGAGSTASLTVAASSTVYTADRWYLITGATQACNVAAAVGLTAMAPTAHAAQITRTAGQTGTTAITFGYPLDVDEINRMRGQKLTLQFAAKTGSGWSPTNGVFTAAIYTGVGAVGKRLAGGVYTTEATVVTVSATLAAGSSATFFTAQGTVSVPTTATQAELQFAWSPVGTASNDIITFDQVVLTTTTSVITPFEDVPFDVSLNMCKRHYQKTFPYGTAPAQGAGTVGALAAVVPIANSEAQALWNFPISMRVAPSVTTYSPVSSNANWRNITGSADVAQTVDSNTLSADRAFISSATVATAASLLAIQAQADAGI